jgi:translation elongation factor aEF-1 beta
MGEVIALIRLMPDGVLGDDEIQTILDEIKNVIKEPVRLGKVEVKNIAFGLKGVDVTVAVPDSEGGLDPLVDILSEIDKVDNVEVIDVGRI